jgi:Tfp pilus assembly protein PilF
VIRVDKKSLFLIPFLTTFAFYFLTLCRTVYTGDSGELAFAIYTMGLAHPPGYPLLTLLGKFFLTIIPGNPAYVLNLMSALLASAAVGAGAFVIRAILFDREERDQILAILISAVTAAIWGFSNALWATAVGLEVYSLGMLLFQLSLLSLLKFLESKNWKLLIAAGYFLFLGLANHLTIISLAPPILVIMLVRRTPSRVWLLLAGLFVISIAAYLYIPLRSAHYPIADWDHPTSFRAMMNHITASRYRGFISGLVPENYFENLWRSVKIWADQTPLFLVPIGFVGLILPTGIRPKQRLILLSIVVLNLLTVALYDIPDIEQYYLPTFFISIAGLASLVIWVFKRLRISNARAAAFSVLTLVTLLTLAKNYGRNDQSENRLGYTYGMNILNCVPPNSILISVADNSNSSLYYLHYVEGVRKDLEIYDPVKTFIILRRKYGFDKLNPQMTGQEACFKLLSSYPEKSYLVKEHLLRMGTPFSYHDLTLTTHGMVYRWGKWPLDPGAWQKIEIPEFDNPELTIDFKGSIMLSNLHLCIGEDLLALGDTSRALTHFREGRDACAFSDEASVHNSLGIFFRRQGWPGMAQEEYELALSSAHLTAFEKANIFVNLGNLRKDRGDFAAAAELYNKALKIKGDNTDARYNLSLAEAYSALNRGDYAGAARYFEAALATPGADPRLIFNLGVLYDKSLNDTAKAIDYYRRFAGLAPGLAESQAAAQRIRELTKH